MDENFHKARDLFIQGVQEFEAGQAAAAESHFQASLDLLPGRVSTLTNLAATRIALSRPQAALDPLERALALDPADGDAWWQRGIALTLLGRHEPALAAFERFLELRPDHAQGWLRHGQALQQLDRQEEALRSYDRALALDPGLAMAWTNRGNILKDLLLLDEAAQSFQKAIAAGGNAELNGYFRAAVLGPSEQAPMPPAPPAGYVRQLFDNYAETFDVHLVQVLHYQAHTLLVQELRGLHNGPFRAALDLGCGTGLCGPLLRPLVQQLDGVDLSPNMLSKAAALQAYDRLQQQDAVFYLQTTASTYDLVLAADMFIYVGDLAPLFRATAAVVDAGGIFCFSVELPDGGADFELKTSLRYGQSEAYVRGLADRHGFDVVQLLRRPLREDKQQAIEGLYFYLRRRD